MARLRAFTLVELLVVLAIISIIAGVLFPVFSTVKATAVKASCMSHFDNVSKALEIYLGDYDTFYVPINHEPGAVPNSRNDRTWVQLLLPYAGGTFTLFECPADTTNRPQPEATFDQDLIPGDLYSQYYTASMRSNIGYNFEYLAPVVKVDGAWTARPKSETSIPDPERMLLFADSVWSVQNGVPSGGGSWLISPPCRYEEIGGRVVDTFKAAAASGLAGKGSEGIYTPILGWDPTNSDVMNVFGGAWPWHLGRVNIATVDNSVRSVTVSQLEAGCDVKPRWAGNIYNRGAYTWSPE